jgi:hypothetical protein
MAPLANPIKLCIATTIGHKRGARNSHLFGKEDRIELRALRVQLLEWRISES